MIRETHADAHMLIRCRHTVPCASARNESLAVYSRGAKLLDVCVEVWICETWFEKYMNGSPYAESRFA
jgi:hypothetical protein